MKGLFVLSTLIGVALSTTLIDQCDTETCDSNFDRKSGPVLFKSKHNVSKMANVTSKIKNMHSMSVEGDVKMDKNEEAVLLRKLSKKLTSMSSTPFNPSVSSTTSSKCKVHSQMLLEGLQNMDLWAVRMHDSTAKISSGVLNGNVNYFGDFDECLKIQGPMDDLNGKYCLTYLQTTIPENMPKLRHLYNLMHSHSAFISEFDDNNASMLTILMINPQYTAY